MKLYARAAIRAAPRPRLAAAAGALLIAGLVTIAGAASVDRSLTTSSGQSRPAATPAAAPPVLILLHGAALNHAMWNSVRRHLDPRWRVVALDLPGHGARRGERFTLAAAVASVTAAARDVAPARVVLVGDSLGGYTAVAAAASGAIPREQLIGLEVGGCCRKIEGWSLWVMHLQGGVVRLVAALVDEDRLVRTRLPRRLKDMGQEQADIDAMIAAGVHLNAYAQAVEALANVDFLADVARIPQPILFFNGEQDEPAMEIEPSFLASAPHATSRRFPGGHGVSLRHPAEFAAMTNQFVEQLAAGATP